MTEPSEDIRPAVAPEEGGAALPASVAEERVSVATQWQLMWWRFKKHKLAMASSVIVILFYLVVVFADFLAYSDPLASEAQRSLLSPQRIHWFDNGRFDPYVYGLTGMRDPVTFKRVYCKGDIQYAGGYTLGCQLEYAWGVNVVDSFYGGKLGCPTFIHPYGASSSTDNGNTNYNNSVTNEIAAGAAWPGGHPSSPIFTVDWAGTSLAELTGGSSYTPSPNDP